MSKHSIVILKDVITSGTPQKVSTTRMVKLNNYCCLLSKVVLEEVYICMIISTKIYQHVCKIYNIVVVHMHIYIDPKTTYPQQLLINYD